MTEQIDAVQQQELAFFNQLMPSGAGQKSESADKEDGAPQEAAAKARISAGTTAKLRKLRTLACSATGKTGAGRIKAAVAR